MVGSLFSFNIEHDSKQLTGLLRTVYSGSPGGEKNKRCSEARKISGSVLCLVTCCFRGSGRVTCHIISDSAAFVYLLLALRCSVSVEHTTELRTHCLHERYVSYYVRYFVLVGISSLLTTHAVRNTFRMAFHHTSFMVWSS